MGGMFVETDLFGDEIIPESRGKVSDKFIFPPFSVLNAREGIWQERKRAWGRIGIEGELGQEGTSIHMDTLAVEKNSAEYVSIFDPVLTELMYTWFCKPKGQIIDPFAGGSVRGIVAAELGYKYWGCDLSDRQIESNRTQAAEICEDEKPEWICGDSIDTLREAPEADFIFSCPPYGDLERYSDNPQDLSTMEYHTFMAQYKRIIMRACLKLNADSFACFVVGDFRDKRTGNYRNFVSDTINAFLEQGLYLYNEAILVTCVGSLSMRINKQFDAGRKMGKTHQNVLVFVKGDAKAATRKINRGAT